MIRGYLVALRTGRAATNAPDREIAEKRAASYWFAMDGITQTAALKAAIRDGLLDPVGGATRPWHPGVPLS